MTKSIITGKLVVGNMWNDPTIFTTRRAWRLSPEQAREIALAHGWHDSMLIIVDDLYTEAILL
jgi:hypothetical protein